MRHALRCDLLKDPDHAACELDLANTGHPPILRFSNKHKKVLPFPSSASPLGLIPYADFINHTVEARAGDLLLIETDGVTEVCDAAGQEFGIEQCSSSNTTNLCQ